LLSVGVFDIAAEMSMRLLEKLLEQYHEDRLRAHQRMAEPHA
jgi:hypothetical protein